MLKGALELEAEVGIEPAYADLQSARVIEDRRGLQGSFRSAKLPEWRP